MMDVFAKPRLPREWIGGGGFLRDRAVFFTHGQPGRLAARGGFHRRLS